MPKYNALQMDFRAKKWEWVMDRVGETQQTSIQFKELENGRIRVYQGYFCLLNFESSTFPQARFPKEAVKKIITSCMAQKKEISRSKISASG